MGQMPELIATEREVEAFVKHSSPMARSSSAAAQRRPRQRAEAAELLPAAASRCLGRRIASSRSRPQDPRARAIQLQVRPVR